MSVIYPVSLNEVKQWLKVDHNEDDAKLTELIASATNTVEAYINTPIITRLITYIKDTWQIDEYGDMVLYLPNVPRTIDYVKIYDVNNNEIVVTNYAYYGRKIVFKDGFEATVRLNQGFKVQFTAGIANNASDTPADIKIILKEIISFFYDSCCDRTLDEILSNLSSYINMERMSYI